MSNYQVLASAFTLSPSATEVLDIDCRDLRDFQIFIKREYTATSTPTDVSLVMKEGNGPYPMDDPTAYVFAVLGGFDGPVEFETTGEDKSSELTAVSAGSGTPVTVVDRIDVVMEEIGRFLRLSIRNKDPLNTVTITITADI